MDGWRPAIGDPTIYGWLTVLAYAAAALLCWSVHNRTTGTEGRAWEALALLLAALAINKEMDLQTLLTDVGRATAKAEGWYPERRIFQAAFIAALIVAGLVTVLTLFRTYRSATLALKGALGGTAVLFVFVLVRASSFEKIDILINNSLNGVRANHALEIGGIVMVASCAAARHHPHFRSGASQR
jgi:hypothetical protein